MKIKTATAKILFNNAKNTTANKKSRKVNDLSCPAFPDIFVSFVFTLLMNHIILYKSHV